MWRCYFSDSLDCLLGGRLCYLSHSGSHWRGCWGVKHRKEPPVSRSIFRAGPCVPDVPRSRQSATAKLGVKVQAEDCNSVRYLKEDPNQLKYCWRIQAGLCFTKQRSNTRCSCGRVMFSVSHVVHDVFHPLFVLPCFTR